MEETALLEGKELRGSKKKHRASAVPSVPEVVLSNVDGEGSSCPLTQDGSYVNPIPIPLDVDDEDPRRRPGFVEKVFNEPRKSLVESYLESRDEENPGLRWRRVSTTSLTSDPERQGDRYFYTYTVVSIYSGIAACHFQDVDKNFVNVHLKVFIERV